MRFLIYLLLLLCFLFLALVIDIMYAAGYNLYSIITSVLGISRLGQLWTTVPFYEKIILFLVLVGIVVGLVVTLAYAVRGLRR